MNMQFEDEIDKISDITDRYFGKDKGRNYIKHDFRRALEGFVQREILLHVMIETSRKRHGSRESVDSKGNVSVAYGDFDPDNQGFLYSIFKNHELGSMLDLRLLLTTKETGTGGSFVKELIHLNTDDFIYHYLHKKEGSTVFPGILTKTLIESERNGQRLIGAEFIASNRHLIESAVEQLVSRAKKFNDINYKDKIVTNYEALKFHKDRQPTKYEIEEVTKDMGGMKLTQVSRKDVAVVETRLISKAMNDFAEIVELYRVLASGVDGLHGSSWPLDTYVKRTFQLFSKDTPMDVQDKVVSDLFKYLSVSFNLSFWSLK